jgi:hypothetical protein
MIGQASLVAEDVKLSLIVERFVPERRELESRLSAEVNHGDYSFQASARVYLAPLELRSCALPVVSMPTPPRVHFFSSAA